MAGQEPEATLSRRRFFNQFIDNSSRRFQHWQQVLDNVIDGVLWDVWAAHPEHILAVGDHGTVLHFNGQHWQSQSSDTRLPLHAVCGWGAERAIAVGWMGVICCYQNDEWQRVQGGITDESGQRFISSRENQPLFGLWTKTDEPNKVWAVGDYGRITHFDGHVWQEVDSGISNHLRSIIGLDDGSLMACGAEGLILRRSRESEHWQIMESDTRANLTRLWARSSSEIYAIGGQYNVHANRFMGCLLHCDGQQWQVLPTPEVPLRRLRAITGDDEQLIVVGDGGSLYKVSHGRIETCKSGVEHDLHGIVLLGDDGAVIVGDYGTVLSTADATLVDHRSALLPQDTQMAHWEPVAQTLTDRVLWSVWSSSPNDVFAVGERGTIIHFDGHHWTTMATPTDRHLHGIWGSSATNVYAVGQVGTILHYDGTHWQQVYQLSVDVTAVAITGFGPHDIFVVGDEGLILRFDGVDWQRMDSNNKDALYGVWGLDAEHVLAVGDFGTVLRWNGKDWKAFNAGTENFLYSVWGDALDNIFVAGLGGTIAHFNGKQWSLLPARQRADLLAIAGRVKSNPLVVGTLGCIMQFDGKQWNTEKNPSDTSLRALWVAEDGTTYAVGDKGVVLRRFNHTHES